MKASRKFRYCLYFMCLVAAWPCVFGLLGVLPDYKLVYAILLPTLIAYALIKGAYEVPRPIQNIIIVQCFLWLIYAFIHQDTTYYIRLAITIIVYFIVALEYKYRDFAFCKIFTGWHVLQVALGALGFVLVLMNILHPIFLFEEANGRAGAFYGLFTSNSFGDDIVRVAGFYDEPGSLACWGMYGLIFNKLFMHNRRVELILMIGLISTLSIAYYIQIVVYLILFYRKQYAQFLSIAVVLLGVFMSFAAYNNDFYNMTVKRFEYNEETGTINGDNRTNQMEEASLIFKKAPILGIGAQNLNKAAIELEDISSNIVSSLAADGIVGVLITYLPLLLLFRYGVVDRKYLYAGIILSLGFIQRPYSSLFLICVIPLYTLIFYAYIDVTDER